MNSEATRTPTAAAANTLSLRAARPTVAAPSRAAAPNAAAKCTRLAAFAFDVDGVLADTAMLHTAAWRRLAEEEGLAFPDDLAVQLRGLSRENSLKRLLGKRRVSPLVFRELADRKNRYYIEMLSSIGPEHAIPGAVELIGSLKELGLRIAAVSLSRNARLVLEKLGIIDCFAVVVDGVRINGSTSGLNRYLLAALEMRTTPDRCVVVEDAPSGIATARQMGMRTIGIGDPDRLCAATLVLDSFENVDAADLIRHLEAAAGPFQSLTQPIL